MQDYPGAYDAVLHVFHLFSGFPPAVRAFCILTQGKTPKSEDFAAVSHSIFCILETFMPTELVGQDRNRLFGAARLLFGLMLQKTKTVKLPSLQTTAEIASHPYLNALAEVTGLWDTLTSEPVLHAVNTQMGLVERGYSVAFAPDSLLAGSKLQPRLTQIE